MDDGEGGKVASLARADSPKRGSSSSHAGNYDLRRATSALRRARLSV
jgi:hypothetical protein